MIHTKICLTCSKKFQGTENQKYCSLQCRNIGFKKRKAKYLSYICEVCGKSFDCIESFGKRKYCSTTCYNKSSSKCIAKWYDVICPVCKETFKVKTSQPKKYCSWECYLKVKNVPLVDIICCVCGKTATKENWMLKAKSGRYYCSNECKHKDPELAKIKSDSMKKTIEENTLKYGSEAANHTVKNGKYVKCSHPGCEEMVYRFKARLNKNDHFYCQEHAYDRLPMSDEQKKKISIINQDPEFQKRRIASFQAALTPEIRKKISDSKTGEKNHNWNGGSSLKGYTHEFMRELRYSTKKRDNFTCQMCHNVFPQNKLHSHHIDYDKDSIDSNNIITLCGSCHGKTTSPLENRPIWTRVLRDMMILRKGD